MDGTTFHQNVSKLYDTLVDCGVFFMSTRRDKKKSKRYLQCTRHSRKRKRRLLQVWARDHGKCVRCGSRTNLTIDHIIPKSLGGPDDHRNYQMMCRDCNNKKGDTLPVATFNFKQLRK